MNPSTRQAFGLLGRGLLLEPKAYDEAAEGDNPFVEGLFLVAVVGTLVGVASAIGALFSWAITPDLNQIKDIVLGGIQAMPWFDFMRDNANAMRMFESQYDLGWQIGRLFAPSAGTALAGLVLTPLGLILSWLWFSVISFGVARLLGGNGALAQTLGAAALAAAPSLLNMFELLPYLSVAAVGIWTLLARYVAIRRVHENLSWARALMAVLAPSLLFWLLVIVVVVLFSSTLGILIGGTFS